MLTTPHADYIVNAIIDDRHREATRQRHTRKARRRLLRSAVRRP